MWFLIGLIAVGVQVPGTMVTLQSGVRSPASSSDGRLAFELRGDLWIADLPNGVESAITLSQAALHQITSGPTWDREPAWTPEGDALVFASDRSGNLDIWRVTVGADGAVGVPQRLTSSAQPESEPTVGADGSVAFVRGAGADADIWILSGGGERQLTKRSGAERSPSFSPSGDRIAYVALESRNRRLMVRSLMSGGG